MIEALAPGMSILLPSGNVVVLAFAEGSEWACTYTSNSRIRGGVNFTEHWLRKWGRQL